MNGIRRSLVAVAVAGVLAGCTPYDPPNKPYAVDSYLDPPKAIYDYHGGTLVLNHPYHCFRCGWF